MGSWLGITIGLPGSIAAPLGGGAFGPDSIDGLQVWLDARENAYEDAGATDACEDGDDVLSWVDAKSSTVWAAITSGEEPQWVESESTLNDHAALDFVPFWTGAANIRSPADMSALSSSTSAEFFWVFNLDSYGAVQSNLMDIFTGAWYKLKVDLHTGAGSGRLGFHDGATWRYSTAYNSLSTGPHILGLRLDASTALAKFRLDGVDDGDPLAYTVDAGYGTTYAERTTLMSNYGGTQQIDAKLAHYLWYDRILSSGDRDDLETYLMDLIGI